MKKIALALAALLALAPITARSQSQPSPPLTHGKVPTAGEWNSYFAAKQDVLRFTPLNQAGGTMGGKLNTAPATVNGVGFSVLPGIAPTAPNEGDIWISSATLFARIGGVTTSFASSNDSRIVGAAQKSANLSDLASISTTRTNLGLGGAALLNVGTATGTVAAGDDSRITGALQASTAAATYAPLASPALAGTPTAPTATSGTSTTQIATTAFVASAVTGAGAGSAPAPAFDTTSATLTSSDLNKSRYATNAITLTMANGGAGWQTGPIKNSNPTTGIVTLAVPSGATLDGTTNGTRPLLPQQRARIIQTGAAAYATDWIEREPRVFSVVSSSVTNADISLPQGYAFYEFGYEGIAVSASGTAIGLQVGSSGGIVTANYTTWYIGVSGGGSAGAGGLPGQTYSYVDPAVVYAPSTQPLASIRRGVLQPGSASVIASLSYDTGLRSNDGNNYYRTWNTVLTTPLSGPVTTLRLTALSGGTITGASIWVRCVPAQ